MSDEKTPSEVDTTKLFADPPAAKKAEARPIVSEKEIAAAKELARKNVEQALKDAEIARIVAEEEARIRREEGKRTGVADKDEPVTLTIDLPEFCDKITVNINDHYWHGYTYTVPRHMADSLREQMQRAHQHQMTLDGKNLTEQYQRTRPVLLSPAGEQPLPEGMAA